MFMMYNCSSKWRGIMLYISFEFKARFAFTKQLCTVQNLFRHDNFFLKNFIESRPKPHIPADRSDKNARIPHQLVTQRVANNGPNPFQSPTYLWVGVCFEWCIMLLIT